MKEFKGTKGSWLAHYDPFTGGFPNGGFQIKMDDDFMRPVAMVALPIGDAKPEWLTRGEADAQLIAAAPELLEACLGMMKYCNVNNVIELVPEYEQMCNAVDKALGEIDTTTK